MSSTLHKGQGDDPRTRTWVKLDESVPEDFRHDVAMLCHVLSDCVADLVFSLSLFEQARIAGTRRIGSASTADHKEWQRESERQRTREAELEAASGLIWGAPDYFERSEQIREQAGAGP